MTPAAAAVASLITFSTPPSDSEVGYSRVADSEAVIAAALVSDHQQVSDLRVIQPPDQFNHPAPSPLSILLIHEWNLPRYCGPGRVLACYLPDTHQLVLPTINKGTVFPGSIDEGALVSLFLHERAHAEGWPAGHQSNSQE